MRITRPTLQRATRCRNAFVYFLTAASLLFSQTASARFELIQEWAVDGLGYAYFSAPRGPYIDGNMYWHDYARVTEFPLWRVRGTVMEPLTGFTPGEAAFELDVLFNVGNMVVMSGTLDGVIKHWRIDGDSVIPLESAFGPVPFHGEYLWTALQSGTLISARDDTHGREFWFMNQDGYSFTQDLFEGFDNSHPTSSSGWLWVPMYQWFQREPITNSRLLLRMDDGNSGPEPWVYDAEANTFQLLADLVPGPEGSYPRWLGALGDYHYFATLDRQIFKTDRVVTQSIEDDYRPSSTLPHFKMDFEFGGDLYVWRQDLADDGGHLLRISSEDEVTQFIPGSPSLAQDIHIESVFVHDGAVYILGEGYAEDENVLKIDGIKAVPSNPFSGVVVDPLVSNFTEKELLVWEYAATVYQYDVFCITSSGAIPVWRKPNNFHFRIANYYESGNWAYVVAYDVLGFDGKQGGRVQLWGMYWPEGCQQAWVEDMILDVGFE